MAYHNFSNLELKETFGVEQVFRSDLFRQVAARQAGDLLQTMLAKQIPFALAQGSEKARSEYIIAPVFFELREQAGEQISVFSGIRFEVDKKRKLDGWCDFLVSRSPYQSALEAPVLIAVEAKREDFEQGTNQCVAEMIAARIYNERRQVITRHIYGCVTTGDVWRFLVLRENQALIETTTFDIRDDLARILGILWAMSFDEVILPE
jgi:hypothetical protein